MVERKPSNASLPPATILLVDDSSVLLDALKEQLWTYGLKVRLAHDGAEALLQAEQVMPDLILLDVMMPGIDGFETCRQLKRNPNTRAIPVIFMTALQHTEDKLAGFEAGGVDYLTKPVDIAEVVARIGTHLNLRATQRALQQEVERRQRVEEVLLQNEAGLRQQAERAQSALQQVMQSEHLLVSEKLAAAGQLSAGVAHEINNPTHYAALAADALNEQLEEFRQFLFQLAGPDADREVLQSLERRFDMLREQVQTILEGTHRVLGIVRDLTTFARAESPAGSRASLGEPIRATMNLVRAKYKHDIEFALQIDDDPEIFCNPPRLNQVFMNLIVNACQAIKQKAAEGDPAFCGRVQVRLFQQGDQLCVVVEDNGSGIDPGLKTQIFDPFFTTKPAGEGTGLGLALSWSIVNEHGGHVDVDSEPGAGARFTVALPM
ncbi:hybrid sensor histidine kinase/response regulator [Pseudomarimonas arenosa]|uniref:histidine kinase n=1 Tax=Pseudomarimonas arenosa TaxID=2774145 RepID=A0AAW3ZKX9_9GAMM|nr:response regulator [Pseudomarimonas arenosa]MBD8526100.1 response regulator [Pseudomarimonas arenosa]